MFDTMSQSREKAFPLSLKIVAGYLVVSGAIGLIWPLTGLGPHHAELRAESLAYKIGAYSIGTLINLVFIIAGIGVFCRKPWGAKMALFIIAFSTLFSMNNFAWGLAGGMPSAKVRAVASVAVGLWNGMWLYVICRNRHAPIHVQGDATPCLPSKTETDPSGSAEANLGLDMGLSENPKAPEEETGRSAGAAYSRFGAWRALLVFLVFELSQFVTGVLLGVAVGIYAAAIDRANLRQIVAMM